MVNESNHLTRAMDQSVAFVHSDGSPASRIEPLGELDEFEGNLHNLLPIAHTH